MKIPFGKTKLESNCILKEVVDLVYDKQLEFTKEKGRKVSLEKTVEKLLRDAYLNKDKNKTA